MPLEGRIVPIAPKDGVDQLLHRLRSAKGQLQAVITMVETDEPCEKILHQLNAIQAALWSAERTLIQCQIHQSSSTILNDSCPDTRVRAVIRLSKLYSLFVKARS